MTRGAFQVLPRESSRRMGTFPSRRYSTGESPRVVLRSTPPLPEVHSDRGVAFPVVRDRSVLATVVRTLETELEEVRRYLSRERHGYLLQLAREDFADLQEALAWARAQLPEGQG